MDAEAGYLLYKRIEQAHVFACWIRGRAEFPRKSVAAILEFFLVDYWHQFGRAIWGAQMRDLLPPRAKLSD
jgi:hypothetical protein